jgi:hypothetical protein
MEFFQDHSVTSLKEAVIIESSYKERKRAMMGYNGVVRSSSSIDIRGETRIESSLLLEDIIIIIIVISLEKPPSKYCRKDIDNNFFGLFFLF